MGVFDLKPTKDGKLKGELQIDKKFADRATIRIMTLTFDGKPQTAGARYYRMPVKKFIKKTPVADSFQEPPVRDLQQRRSRIEVRRIARFSGLHIKQCQAGSPRRAGAC